VCDAANSADHNQCNAAYCYRRRGLVHLSVCVYVMGIITAKRLNRLRCRLAEIIPHNHVLHGGPDAPQGKDNFGGGQTWACPVSLHWGMDLWGDDAAFCQINLTSCFLRSHVSGD